MTLSLFRIIVPIVAAVSVASRPVGPGVPADFPTAPGLSKCNPTVSGPLVMCKWKGVDGHAVYTYYQKALPKAGYTLRDGKETTTPSYDAALSFIKGDVKGALSITGSDAEVDFFVGS
jgi:hypothetical protein